MNKAQDYLIKEGLIDVEPNGRMTIDRSYYTPNYIIEAIKEVMGEIDIDVASCKAAQKRIQAKMYYDEKIDGLKQPWVGRIFLCANVSQAALFIQKAEQEYQNGNMTEAIIHAQTGETWEDWFHDFLVMGKAFCFMKRRIVWRPCWSGYEKEYEELGVDYNQFPPYSIHGSIYAYLGPHVDKFKEVFSRLGTVIVKK